MFDVSWQELLVVGIVALIVVGPKELPTLLRTVGKYVGAIKRQASEFRAQFDEAMRESELDQIRKDVEKIKSDAESTLRDVEHSVHSEVAGVKHEIGDAANSIAGGQSHPDAHDANGLPFPVGEPSDALKSNAGSAAVAAAVAAAAAAAPPAASESVSATPASPSPSSSSNASGTSPAKADA